jgi:hypothetical protein
MKKFTFALLTIFNLLFISNFLAQGQVSTSSTNGYTVRVVISNIVLNKWNYQTNSCNYNVSFNYNITFSGTNIPASLYTLQGNVKCSQNTFFDLPNNGGSGSVTSATATYHGGNPNNLTLQSICNKIDIQVHGPNLSSKTINIPIGNPLPIELLNFDVSSKDKKVILNWSTASERDNDYFTIERTIDGINFEKIGELKGAGTSSSRNDYQFTDNNPIKGISYYRLSQTDYNGEMEVFEPQSIEIEDKNNISFVFPNPTSDSKINVNVFETDQNVTLNIYNFMGQLEYSTIVDAKNGNIISEIDLPTIGNTFILEVIEGNSSIEHHKISAIR